MFSKISRGILSGVTKFFTKERLAILFVFIVLMLALAMYATKKTVVKRVFITILGVKTDVLHYI